ncbi:MAG: hypothetical protein ABIG39_02730 [Candidatus Micrarchaeota archaeon]
MKALRDTKGQIRVFDDRHLVILRKLKSLMPKVDRKSGLGFDVAGYRKGIYEQRIERMERLVPNLGKLSGTVGETLGALKTYRHFYKKSGDESITVPLNPVGNLASEFKGKVDALIRIPGEGATYHKGALRVRIDSLEALVDELETMCNESSSLKTGFREAMIIGIKNNELADGINKAIGELEKVDRKLRGASRKSKVPLEKQRVAWERQLGVLQAKIMSFSQREKGYYDSMGDGCPDIPNLRDKIKVIREDITSARTIMEHFDVETVREAAGIIAGTDRRIRSPGTDANYTRQLTNEAKKLLKVAKGHMEKVSKRLARATDNAERLFDAIFLEITGFDKSLKTDIDTVGKTIAFNEALIGRSGS